MNSSNMPIVCYAEDWGRLPSSTEHLMRCLAKTHPILWVDSMGLRTPSAASSGDLKRIWTKISKFAGGIREVEPNIWVLTPLVVPLHKYSPVRRLNRRLMKHYIGRFLRKMRWDQFIQWSSSPTSSSMLHSLGETADVYYIGDEFSEFTQFDKELVIELERELLVRSDLLFVVSDRLYTTKSQFNAVVEKLPHGCDYEHFAHTALLSERDIPEDLAGIPRPRIGYYGLIRDWFDFPMLGQIFERHPEWSLVLVGPSDTDTSSIASLANVHLLGPKLYQELPQYLRGFDVGIIPYRKTEITLNANPLKLLEYMSSGVPVVTTDLPAVAEYREGLRIAGDATQFESAIGDALSEKGRDQAKARQEIGRRNSWQSRVERVESVFAKNIYPLTHAPKRPVVMHLIAAMDIAGAEKVVLSLVKQSGDMETGKVEHRVTSFVRMSDGRGSDFLREIAASGTLIDRIPMYKGWDLGDVRALRRIMRRHQVKILHTHGYKADIIGVIAARTAGIPVIATAHGFGVGKDKLGRNEKIGRWFLKWADRVIAVSENVKETLMQSGIDQRKIVLLPNAIDFACFAQSGDRDFRGEWGIKPDEIVIGTAGRLAVEKAQTNLIEAVALLPETLKAKVRIVIAGEGPLQDALIAVTQSTGLENQVILAGFVADMRSYYQSLDLFCLPSLTEGHPLTVMEAAACGKPVVASKVGAIGQLIADGVDGFTPAPGDLPGLAKALEIVLSRSDQGAAMGEALRAKLQKACDIGPWVARIHEIYEELHR